MAFNIKSLIFSSLRQACNEICNSLTLIAIFMQDISSFLNTWTADSKLKLYLKIPYSGSTYVRSFDSGLKKLFNET